jgi:hypothetical protein
MTPIRRVVDVVITWSESVVAVCWGVLLRVTVGNVAVAESHQQQRQEHHTGNYPVPPGGEREFNLTCCSKNKCLHVH